MHDLSAYGQEDAKNRANTILLEYGGLVKQIASHLIVRLPSNIDIDDLIQVGMIGLLEVATNFDASKGTRFETFAKIRIRGAMLDEVRRSSYLPRSVMTSIRQINAARSEIEQELGRSVQDPELADHMGISLDQLQHSQWRNHDLQTVSIEDDHVENELDSQFSGFSITDEIDRVDFSNALSDAIKQLTEREQLIYSMYYRDELNLKEIALVLGLTESRVCQIQKQSAKTLRTLLENWLD